MDLDLSVTELAVTEPGCSHTSNDVAQRGDEGTGRPAGYPCFSDNPEQLSFDQHQQDELVSFNLQARSHPEHTNNGGGNRDITNEVNFQSPTMTPSHGTEEQPMLIERQEHTEFVEDDVTTTLEKETSIANSSTTSDLPVASSTESLEVFDKIHARGTCSLKTLESQVMYYLTLMQEPTNQQTLPRHLKR